MLPVMLPLVNLNVDDEAVNPSAGRSTSHCPSRPSVAMKAHKVTVPPVSDSASIEISVPLDIAYVIFFY